MRYLSAGENEGISHPGPEAVTNQLKYFRERVPPASSLFQIDIRSPLASTRASSKELILKFWEDPPPWVPPHWETSFTIGYVPSPRSKARTSSTRRPTEKRIRAAMAKERPGEVFSVGCNYVGTGEGISFVSMSWPTWTHFTVAAHGITEASLRDPRFGPWVSRALTRVIEAVPDLARAFTWFGHDNRPPYLFRQDMGLVPGYSWATVLTPAAIAELGGIEVVRRGSASIVSAVDAPDGSTYAVVVLTDAPADVTDSQLREWRELLRPVLPPNYRDERTQVFMAAIDTHPWQFDRPPMILADDWPEPPHDSRYYPPATDILI